MVTRLTLVRHGAVDLDGVVYGQRVDPGLSPAGQAELAALQARSTLPAQARVLRTPTLRTAQSAALLALDDRATLDARWAERDLGAWEGRRWDEVLATLPEGITRDLEAYAALTPPDGESVAAMRTRISTAMEDVARDATPDAPGSDIVVVCHGGTVRCAVAHVLDLPDVMMLRLRVATASVTRLTCWQPGVWTLESIGA